jgi:anti-sigma factor RsiW
MTTVAGLSCEAAGSLVMDYISGESGPKERRQLEAHLIACPACHARVAFNQGLRNQLRALERAQVPVMLLERVRSIAGRDD